MIDQHIYVDVYVYTTPRGSNTPHSCSRPRRMAAFAQAQLDQFDDTLIEGACFDVWCESEIIPKDRRESEAGRNSKWKGKGKDAGKG